MTKITYRSDDSVLLKTIERATLGVAGQFILLLLLFDFFCLFLFFNDAVLAPTLIFFMVLLIICFCFLCAGYYPGVRTIISSLHPGPLKYKKGTKIPTFITSSRATHYPFQNKSDKTRYQGYTWTRSSNDQQRESIGNTQLNESGESSSDEMDQFIASLKERVADHKSE